MFPRTLSINGRWMNASGSGRAPGAHIYLDPSAGRVVEVYRARITGTGPHFAIGAVDGNTALSSVRIDHAHVGRPLTIGETVLIGPIGFQSTGAFAHNAWPSPSAPHRTLAPSPTVHRTSADYQIGIIAEVAVGGAYGWLVSLQGGRFFVHRSAVQSGRIQPGTRVIFQPSEGPRGPLALAVRLA